MTALDDIAAWIRATTGHDLTAEEQDVLNSKLEYHRLEDEKALIARVQGLVNQALPVPIIPSPEFAWDPKLKVVMSLALPKFMDPVSTDVERARRGLPAWTPNIGAKEQNEPPIP